MTVLWFSRHEMTADQQSDLRRIYGEDIAVVHKDGTVKSAADVAALAVETQADVIACVLPPNILAELVNPRVNTRPVIRAIANRVPTGNTVINPATGREETEYCFQHAGWERVLKIEIVTERL